MVIWLIVWCNYFCVCDFEFAGIWFVDWFNRVKEYEYWRLRARYIVDLRLGKLNSGRKRLRGSGGNSGGRPRRHSRNFGAMQ